MKKLAVTLLPLVVLWACSEGAGDPEMEVGGGARPPQDHAWVIFGTDTVLAEVADDDQERQQGLMNRESLEPGTGMLFVFQDERPRSFWMKDTYIPLDIAFLDATQVVVDVQQMEPLTEEYHRSASFAMYALEVPQGWFAEHGVEVGSSAEIMFGRR